MAWLLSDMLLYVVGQADELAELAEAKLETLLDGQAWGFLVGTAGAKVAAGRSTTS